MQPFIYAPDKQGSRPLDKHSQPHAALRARTRPGSAHLVRKPQASCRDWPPRAATALMRFRSWDRTAGDSARFSAAVMVSGVLAWDRAVSSRSFSSASEACKCYTVVKRGSCWGCVTGARCLRVVLQEGAGARLELKPEMSPSTALLQVMSFKPWGRSIDL